MSTVLVFAPHPDDEVIGCGGRIRQHIQRGDRVIVAFVTSGEAGDIAIQGDELASIRKTEASAAAKILGYSDLVWLELPDGGVAYSTDQVQRFATLIRNHKPDSIYCPHSDDAHPDHRATYQIVAEAVIRAAGNVFAAAGAEPWQIKNWLTYEVWTPLSQPQYAVAIDAEIGIKLAALQKYSSQLANVAYDEAVAGLNRYRGAMTGLGTYAECYGVSRVTLE